MRWAALAALAAIGLGGASEAPPKPKPAEQRAGDNRARASSPILVKIVPTPKTKAETREDQQERNRQAATNFWLIGIGIVQAVLTGITLQGLRHARVAAEAADTAADAAKASIDHLRTIERAYAFGGIDEIKADPKTGAASFNFIIQNAGRTPARVREVHLAVNPLLSLDPKQWPDEADYSATEVFFTDTIFEGGSKSPQIELVEQVTVGVVYGYILYDDIFQKSHFSRFCMAYSGIEGRASTFGGDSWNTYD